MLRGWEKAYIGGGQNPGVFFRPDNVKQAFVNSVLMRIKRCNKARRNLLAEKGISDPIVGLSQPLICINNGLIAENTSGFFDAKKMVFG